MKLIALLACALACACNTPSTGPSDTGTKTAPQVMRHPYVAPDLQEPPLSHAHHRAIAVDTRTPAQLAAAACTRLDGSWACPSVQKPLRANATGTTPIIPPSWTVPAWYINPSTGNDSNSCTTSGSPCLTFAEIYFHRWGGNGADLQQTTTINMLGGQVPGQDLISLNMSQASGEIDFVGTLTQVTTATIGTFTAQNPNAGTPNTITASGQSGAYWTTYVGDLVNDTTAGAWFWVNADLGSATALITNPVQLATPASNPTFPPYVTIANSDALTIYTGSALNLYTITNALVTVFDATIPGETIVTPSGTLKLYESTTGTTGYVSTQGTSGAGRGPTIFSSINSQTSTFNSGSGFWIAGAIVPGPLTVVSIGSQSGIGEAQLDGDILLAAGATNILRFYGQSRMSRVYLPNVLYTNNASTIVNGTIEMTNSSYPGNPAARLWGPGQVRIDYGLKFVFDAIFATGTILLTGSSFSNIPLCFDDLCSASPQNAYPWVPGSHAYGAVVALTVGNIDANNGGLINPLTTSMTMFR